MPDKRKKNVPGLKNSTNVPRVLIVDDELSILRFLKTALDSGEFSLHQAENGHAALAAATAVRPDIILLDLGLPDLDGVEVRAIPLLMTDPKATAEMVGAGVELAADVKGTPRP